MDKLPIPFIDVHQNNGVLVTTSRCVAQVFEKNHRDVLRDIRGILESNPDKDFGLRNFAQSSYRNEQNKEQPEFLITKDGLVMLGSILSRPLLRVLFRRILRLA